MSGKILLFGLVLSLLLAAACVLGAESSPEFPTYKEGEVTLPADVTVLPQFSTDGNYGLVAAADTLYSLELRHGRVHGKTGLTENILAFAPALNGFVYLVTETNLVSIEGFSVVNSIELPSKAVTLTVCGSNPVVMLETGSIFLFNGSDLSLVNTFDPSAEEIVFIEGFSNCLIAAFSDSTLRSYSIPDFDEVISEKYNGVFLFLRTVNSDRLIFSTDFWNEVAVCSPLDLKITEMFTFPETPAIASADSDLSCIYAVCPSQGLQVCLANGEIAWRTKEFGLNPLVTVSSDCEAALVVTNRVVSLLLR